MNDPKPWWKSKTQIFNLSMGILTVVIGNFHLLKVMLPDNIYGILLFTTIIINAILRVVTKQPLSIK